MKLKSDWPFSILLVILSAFYIWGIQVVPFHPDETTQMYMSSDFEALFSQPSSLFWRPEQAANPRQRYRELDAPLTRYLLGLGRTIAGQRAISADWDWSKSWDENLNLGAYPDPDILFVARLTITLLLPLSLIFIYSIGVQIQGNLTGFLGALFLGTQAVVLLHGRRAMAEGVLLLGVLLAVWCLFQARDRPWLVGLGLAVAFNAKQSALALLPVGMLAVVWLPSKTPQQFKKIIVTTQPDGNTSEKRVCAGGSTPCAHPFFGPIRLLAEQLQIIKNLIQLGSVFAVVTIALNPLYWRHPIQAVQSALTARNELTHQQIIDTHAIAPDKYLDTPGQRLLMLFANIYIGPAEHSLVGNLAPTLADVATYIAIPGHNLFRGIVWGTLFFGITLTGFVLAIRNIVGKRSDQRWNLTVLVLATLFQGAALIAAVPLPWARFSIPLIPFTSLWSAYGIFSIFRGKKQPPE